jgi:uncharacterized membrane protein YjdF
MKLYQLDARRKLIVYLQGELVQRKDELERLFVQVEATKVKLCMGVSVYTQKRCRVTYFLYMLYVTHIVLNLQSCHFAWDKINFSLSQACWKFVLIYKLDKFCIDRY